MIDIELGVMGGRLLEGHALTAQAFVPAVDVLADEREDDALRVARGVIACAEAEKGVAAHTVDAAGALVEDER